MQFARFVGNAVQGEFGLSLRQGRRVSTLIVERLPATLELSLAAALIALVVGIPLGVFAALKRGTFASQVAMTVSLLGVSLPTFLIGILLILLFCGDAQVAAQLRPRRHGVARRLDHRLPHRRRLEAPDPAGDHAVRCSSWR